MSFPDPCINAKLLHALADVDGIEWIRLHYAYPSKFPMEVLDAIRDLPKVCNYLDMPLQHISDRVLNDMRRQITKADAGNVTLFAFDAGQELSEHTAPFDALVFIVEGQAEIIISGKSFQLKSGQAIIMPANDPHAVKATSQFKMLLTMIRS